MIVPRHPRCPVITQSRRVTDWLGPDEEGTVHAHTTLQRLCVYIHTHVYVCDANIEVASPGGTMAKAR